MGAVCSSNGNNRKMKTSSISASGLTDDVGLTTRVRKIIDTKAQLQFKWDSSTHIQTFRLESPWVSSTANENINNVYQVIESIGEGYMGKVYKASLRGYPKMIYAIKSIKKSHLAEKNFRYFKSEVDILKELDHPNIVKFYECYQDKTNYNMVLEYCDGPDIVKLVEKTKGLPHNLIRKLFFQAVLAINYLHQIGICHRDIKLDNFLLTSKDIESCDIKLIDFGFAKKFNEGKLTSQVGTPWYVAPEILEKGIPYTQMCDNWSLGVMLYIMLFAEPPFKGRTNYEIFQNTKEKLIDFSDPKFNAISSDLVFLLDQLLKKDPSQRITLTDALRSPWFNPVVVDIYSGWTAGEMKSLIKKLKVPRSYGAFRKEVIKIMVGIFFECQEVKELTKSFYCCDYLNNGLITSLELENLFDETKQKSTPEDINNIIENLQLKTFKAITFSEFIAGTAGKSFFTEYNRLKLTFDRFDIDRTGYITEDNIRGCFERFGYSLNDSTIRNFIQDFDINKEGAIDFEVFCKIMRK